MEHIPVKYVCRKGKYIFTALTLVGAGILGGCRTSIEKKGLQETSGEEQVTVYTSENNTYATIEGTREGFDISDEKQKELLQEAALYPKTEKIPGVMEEGESFLMQAGEGEKARMMEQAENFLRTRFEVDYRDMQQLEDAVAYHRKYCSYFSEDLLWKTDHGEIVMIREFVSEYWTMLTETRTVMQTRILSQEDLMYHNGEDVWRGIVAIKITECEDIEALTEFLCLPSMELNKEYYGIYEVAFCYRSSILDADTILNPDQARRKLFITREGCIGEWRSVDETGK